MSLPVRLGVGLVSIYGASGDASIQGAYSNNKDIYFGIVNAMGTQFGITSVGQSVQFNVNDSETVYYMDTPYYILPEEKIISIENNITPP